GEGEGAAGGVPSALMCRKRFTSAARATASMFWVARVWRASKVTPRLRCSRMMPTRCTTALQPSTEAGSVSGFSTSPGTRSIDSKPWRSRSEPWRTSARTRKPWATRARMTCFPTKPVPPVTKMRCIEAKPSTYDKGMRLIALLLGLLLGVGLVGRALAQTAAPELSGLDDAARDATAAGDVPGAVIVVGQGDRVL